MRKHFLILMLFALLPLAGWAADPAVTVNPVGATALTYNKNAHQLLSTAGTASDGNTLYYAVVDAGATAPATSAATTTVPTKTNAGSYDVYYWTKNATTNAWSDSKKITVSIAKAATIVVQAKNPSMVYGGESPTLADFYEITGNNFLEGEGVATLGAPVEMPAIDVVNAGSRNFTLVAREYINYNVSVTQPNGTLTIAKKAITVTTAAITGTHTYGGVKPTPTVADYSAGLVGEDQLEGTATFDFKKVVGENEVLVEDAVLPAGTYRVYPKGLSNDNYAITYAYAEFTVGKKNLASSMIAAMPTVTYNGANQAPTLTITDGTLPAPALTTDYTTAWTYKANATAEVQNVNPAAENAFKNAGIYTVTLTAADGNYKDPATKASKTYTIEKKTLYVKTKNVEKTYDGLTPYAPAADATHLTFVGLEASDNAVYSGFAVTLGASSTAGLTTGVDAGEYPINVADNNFATTNALATNYTPEYGSIGKLTINQKEITITPNPITKNYGVADSYVDGVVATGIAANAEDLEEGKIQLTGGLVASESITTLPTLTREEGEAADTYALTAAGAVIKNNNGTAENAEDDVDVTKNYNITYAPSTFTIAKGGFNIWADDKESVFGGELKALTYTVAGIPAADADKIVFGEGAITTNATAASNRGTYTITIDKSKIDFSQISDLYDITKVTVVPGNYTINPAPLKIKAADQAHTVGQTVTAASLDNIEFVTEGVSTADKNVVIANITLAFSTATCVVPVDGDKKLTAAATTTGWTGTAAATADKDKGVWVNGIVIDAAAYNALTTANYTLTGTGAEAKAGTLYVTAAADPITFDNTATTTAQIDNVAGKIKDVTISTAAKARTLYANAWNALVLPFDITPFDFTTAIETYAVFDVLQAGGDALNFKITINKIPAYTPFLVKVDKEINLSGKTFQSVVVKAIDNDALTQSLSADANYKFVGTVKQASVAGPTWTIYPNEETGAIQLNPHKTATTIKAFTAYLTTIDGTNPINAPQVFIEEPDGSTTAISTINAEGVAMKADGWYTVNGVKLQGMPTEKGVYINNGKKVVLK